MRTTIFGKSISIGAIVVPAIAALLTIILASGCGGGDDPLEFRIGLIVPITGAIPEAGQKSVEAATLFVDEVNAKGGLGVGGKTYKLVLFIEDDEDKAEVAASKALHLIEEQGVIVLIGPQASRNAIPASFVAERAGIPMISPWSTNPETTLGKNWVFRAGFIDPFQGGVLANFVNSELGGVKVAVLFDVASAYNKGLAEAFKLAFEALDGKVVAFETYTAVTPDVSDQMGRIKDSGAEVLFLSNYAAEVVEQAKLARELGLDVQIIGGDTWAQISASDRLGLEGAYFSTHYFEDPLREVARDFVTRYVEEYGEPPDDVAALTYDALSLMVEAVRREDAIGPEAIRSGLSDIRYYEGVTGSFLYDGISGDPIKSAILLKIEGGKFAYHSRVDP